MEGRRLPRPHKQQPLSCQRCNSTNTKFCYYNNYSLSQPRHFCKACKRYWTQGGSLRNVPIGGASRKNKRDPPSPLPSPSTHKRLLLADPTAPPMQNPNPSFHEGHDLVNLGGLFHAGVPLSPFMAVPGVGGYGEDIQDGAGGGGEDYYGFWINGVMGGGGGGAGS